MAGLVKLRRGIGVVSGRQLRAGSGTARYAAPARVFMFSAAKKGSELSLAAVSARVRFGLGRLKGRHSGWFVSKTASSFMEAFITNYEARRA